MICTRCHKEAETEKIVGGWGRLCNTCKNPRRAIYLPKYKLDPEYLQESKDSISRISEKYKVVK